jgi:hypothetical protein
MYQAQDSVLVYPPGAGLCPCPLITYVAYIRAIQKYNINTACLSINLYLVLTANYMYKYQQPLKKAMKKNVFRSSMKFEE